jgi:hypothetical protein
MRHNYESLETMLDAVDLLNFLKDDAAMIAKAASALSCDSSEAASGIERCAWKMSDEIGEISDFIYAELRKTAPEDVRDETEGEPQKLDVA